MLILTNFLVIALALFLALVVAASAANLHGLARGDSLPLGEFGNSKAGPQEVPDEGLASTQPPSGVDVDILVTQPMGERRPRVRVLGQPLKLAQEPRLVSDSRKRA